jgi:hypothetical protein
MRLLAAAAIQKGSAAGSFLRKAKFWGLLAGRSLAGDYLLAEKGARRETAE